MQITSRREERRQLLYKLNIAEPKGMAIQVPGEWKAEFDAWMAAECARNDRASWSIGALHISFAEWCAANRTVACSRVTFESLLLGEKCVIEDGLVHGLFPVAEATSISEYLGRTGTIAS